MRTGLDLSNLKIAVITGAGPGLLNENNQKAQGLCRGRQGESSLEGSGQSFPLGAHRGWRRSGLHAASLGGVGGTASLGGVGGTCCGSDRGHARGSRLGADDSEAALVRGRRIQKERAGL